MDTEICPARRRSLDMAQSILRNNLDTNSAWILMGATMRLAQSIGLHEENLSHESTSSSLDHYHRRRLWYILVNSTSLAILIIRTETIHHAAEAVESFLDMHHLSSNVCRSWAFVQNAVCCAFTLRSFGATGAEGEYADLMGRLIYVLEREERMSEWEDADTNVRCFGPYSRALRALRDSSEGGSFGVRG